VRVTDEMVNAAKRAWSLALENGQEPRCFRAALEAALADVPEPRSGFWGAEVAEARIAELEAKLAKVRDAWGRYQRADEDRDIDREEFEGTVAEVVEDP